MNATEGNSSAALSFAGRSAGLHHADFFCHAPAATRVLLIMDIDHPQSTAHAMDRMPDGCWTANLELSHGYHQYLFLVDGKPMLDPNSAGTVRNEKNQRVSLVAVS